MVDVPIFVSIPTRLHDRQRAVYDDIRAALKTAGLAPRTLTGAVSPDKSPLAEITRLARQCAGGLILGFRQTSADRVVRWADSPFEMRDEVGSHFPSPWNQLEAGILYSLGVPMLIFAEDGVTGGIFDTGMGNFLIHGFNADTFGAADAEHMSILIREWGRHVTGYHHRRSPQALLAQI